MSIINASVSGMLADSNWLSSISQNVANANTTGYKTVETDFSTLVDQVSSGPRTVGGQGWSRPAYLQASQAYENAHGGQNPFYTGGNYLTPAGAAYQAAHPNLTAASFPSGNLNMGLNTLAMHDLQEYERGSPDQRNDTWASNFLSNPANSVYNYAWQPGPAWQKAHPNYSPNGSWGGGVGRPQQRGLWNQPLRPGQPVSLTPDYSRLPAQIQSQLSSIGGGSASVADM